MINPNNNQAYNLLHEGVLAMAHAEQAGFRVDMGYVERKIPFLIKKMDRLEEQFKTTDFYKHWEHSSHGKVNINSNAQLAYFLYKVKKIQQEDFTNSGQGKTDEESLKQLNIPELDLLLEIGRFKKPIDVLTGFSKEQVDGYVHPFYNLHLVRSYRSSSDSPNFQNIPKRDEEIMQLCRKALYPRPGHQFIEIDYSGVEVRINACINKDPTLIKYVSDPSTDMHGDMAQQLFLINPFNKKLPEHGLLRQAAKNGFVFPEFYGDYYKNCASNLVCNWGKLGKGRWRPGQGVSMPSGTLSDHLISKNIKSLDEYALHVQKIEKDFWGKRFKVYTEWKEQNWNFYRKNGYIELPSGFICKGVMDRKQVNNYPGQGGAFHCLLWSFIQLDKVRISQNWRSRLVGQIHDSIILDVHPEELEHVIRTARRITCQELRNAWEWIIVPLDVDVEVCPVDGSWAEKKKYELK